MWVKNLVKHSFFFFFFFFFQTETFVDTSRDGISHEVLVNLTTWHDSSASHELVVNFTDLLLILDSSPISHTYPLKINPHKYREMIEEMTIKFGTKLKTTKAS